MKTLSGSTGRLPHRSCVILLGALLSACASSAPIGAGDGRASRVEACRSGDTIVSSESACLTDDSSCYALTDGNWCTGPRAASCPTGSSAVPAGSACPAGARCFRISESLECLVQY